MTLGELSRADKTQLEAVRQHIEENEELANACAQLMWEVAQIPYVCGHPDCSSPGCLAIRRAQATVRELLPIEKL